jgi:hypothetical protein
MGRDIYWTARQSLTQSTRQQYIRGSKVKTGAIPNEEGNVPLDANELLQGRIAKLDFKAFSNHTLRNHEIERLLDEMDAKLNPRSFNWREAFVSMDNKLDELKFQVDADELLEIEQFDKRNYVMFTVSNSQHVDWIKRQIDETKKSPYYGLAKISNLSLIGWSVLGLASIPLKRQGINRGAEFFGGILWISAAIVVKNAGAFGINEPPLLYGISIGALILFLLMLSGNFIVRNELEAKIEYITNRVKVLEDYLGEVQKIKM